MVGSLDSFSSCAELSSALHRRAISSVELVEFTIARIKRLDGSINAIVVRDFDAARDLARAADAALARGEWGPLLGVPFTVKESFNVVGLPTTWGIPRYTGWQPTQTAESVDRLRMAGAILIGKSNVPYALSDWQCANEIYGRTNNPWDLSRTPGGSSGGGAAALAAGLVSLELGSDIAGSLRAPAHYCGIYAHKPSYGLVSMAGHAPPALGDIRPTIDLAVAGPMARTAADLKLAFDILTAPPGQPHHAALPASRHEYLRGFRVLLLNEHPLMPTAEPIGIALDAVGRALTSMGTTVGQPGKDFPDLIRATSVYQGLLRRALRAPRGFDVLSELERAAAPLLTGLAEIADDTLLEARDRMLDQWSRLFRDWDVVVCPTMPTLAFEHTEEPADIRSITVNGTRFPYFEQVCWASLATGAGLPATIAPYSGRSDPLPVGIQIIGPSLGDHTTLRFAELASQEFFGFTPPNLH